MNRNFQRNSTHPSAVKRSLPKPQRSGTNSRAQQVINRTTQNHISVGSQGERRSILQRTQQHPQKLEPVIRRSVPQAFVTIPPPPSFKRPFPVIKDQSDKGPAAKILKSSVGGPIDPHIRLTNSISNVVVKQKEVKTTNGYSDINNNALKMNNGPLTTITESLTHFPVDETKSESLFELKIVDCVSPSKFMFQFNQIDRDILNDKIK